MSERTPLIICLCGMAGVGKGRLIQLLREQELFPFEYISVSSQLDHDHRLKAIKKSGNLAPDSDVMFVIRKEVIRILKGGSRVVFVDGAPRTIGQAQGMVQMMREQKCNLIMINITASKEACLKRAQSRPGAREDDKDPKTISRRHDAYHANIANITGFFKEEMVTCFSVDNSVEDEGVGMCNEAVTHLRKYVQFGVPSR